MLNLRSHYVCCHLATHCLTWLHCIRICHWSHHFYHLWSRRYGHRYSCELQDYLLCQAWISWCFQNCLSCWMRYGICSSQSRLISINATHSRLQGHEIIRRAKLTQRNLWAIVLGYCWLWTRWIICSTLRQSRWRYLH